MKGNHIQQRINSFDCLKGMACIAVVFIHFNFEGDIGLAVKAFCRFGVPVFFCISGFFLLSDGTIDDGKIVDKIRHILGIVVGAGIFYFIFTILINNLQSSNWDMKQFAISRLTADKIVKFFITNDPFLYSHLWFLMGLIYCYVFVLLFFAKGRRLTWIKVMAPLLLVVYSCFQEFGEIFGIKRSIWIPGTENRVYFYNLFILRALPAVLFGILMNKYRDCIERLPVKTSVLKVLVVLGGFLAILERFTIGESQFFIGSYLTVASLFVLALKNPDWKIAGLSYIGRELSMYVYILHIAVGRVVDIAARVLRVQETTGYLCSKPFMILTVSILLAHCLTNMKKRIGKVLR